MTLENQAAYLDEAARPLRVGPAPVPKPGPDQVLVCVKAIGLNPVDWKMQDYGIFINKFPDILGCDAAGEVVEVGSAVQNVQVGHRVLVHALRLGKGDTAYSAFQKYVLGDSQAVTPLPDNVSFEAASALPLSLSTAAHGLYSEGHLGLPLPTNDPKASGKTILIWGGSGSVGAAAIQLAVASGLDVVSTSSPKNFDFVKSLGAKDVFDYKKPSIVADLVSYLKGKDFVGAYDGTGEKETVQAVADIVSQLGGGKVASALETAEAPNVTVKGVFAPSVHANPEQGIGKAVFQDFLIKALKTGQLRPAPPAKVVNSGLEDLQKGMDELKKGVSATKLVVTL